MISPAGTNSLCQQREVLGDKGGSFSICPPAVTPGDHNLKHLVSCTDAHFYQQEGFNATSEGVRPELHPSSLSLAYVSLIFLFHAVRVEQRPQLGTERLFWAVDISFFCLLTEPHLPSHEPNVCVARSGSSHYRILIQGGASARPVVSRSVQKKIVFPRREEDEACSEPPRPIFL